ncbi:MAG: hypothetical protein Pg6C_06050 [Treponemataceae bacterium]|nr:MAG: hypothetical protein Pg6C_06050 [Treponemataceae bacterium]
MNPEREQLIKENVMKNKTRKIALTFQIQAERYRELQEAAREAKTDILTFISAPRLECWYCPCGNKESNSCAGAGDGSCLEVFHKFVFQDGV